MNAIAFQAVLVVPLLLLLVGYTLSHPVRRKVHRYLLAVLVSMIAWSLATGFAFSDLAADTRTFAFALSNVAAAALTPLCLLTIGHYARIEFIDSGRADWLLWPPFAFFALAMLTDPLHHWVYEDWSRFVEVGRPDEFAGPVFWAFNAWGLATVLASLGICASGIRRAHDRTERIRMGLLMGAVALPTVAHTAFLGSWLPIDYPLTLSSMGLTALLLVAGVQRFDLLEGRPPVQRDVLEHMRDGLLVANGQGTVVDANATALEMLDCGSEDVLGQALVDVVQRLLAEARGDSVPSACAIAECGSGHRRIEIETRDGRCIELYTVSSHDGEAQETDGRFLMLRDRSVERRNQRLLHHRQKLESVGVLAAGVAHEVNNPLSYVRANLGHVNQVIREVEKSTDHALSPDDLAELRDVVDESLVGLDRIASIVDRLLRFSRPSGGRARVDLDALVDEAIRFASLHRSQAVAVERVLAADLPTLNGSPDRLLQAMLNLMLNARQALGDVEDARLRVSTRRRGDEVEIAVEDNGPGIDPEIRERIFDPFFTTRAPGQGTGLGLTIAFDLVREHDGTLEVGESELGGAAFLIRLPIEVSGGEPASADQSSEADART